MARPLILISVVLVYALGVLIARAESDTLNLSSAAWGLAALILVSISIHYTNEYADVETDKLTARTPFSGGSGVLARGDTSPLLALIGAWVTLILGVGVAFIGIAVGTLNCSALILLLIGAFGGWMYSLPPLKLAWCECGEIDNAILGGLILPLYGVAAQMGGVSVSGLIACIPFTIFVFLNLLATTWADRCADAQVGKRTLATIHPPRRLRAVYGIGAMVAIGLLFITLPLIVAAISLIAVPFAVWGWWTYTRRESPAASVITMIVLLIAQMMGWWVV